MTETDPFRFDDGAYVLGALDADERAAFEAHLLDCADCRARVAEARATSRLLMAVPADAELDVEPPPDTLLPGLLRRAARERGRRRLVTSGLGAAAAAAVVALVVALWPVSEDAQRPAQRPVAQQFTAVRAAPVAATGVLVAKQWGTQINLQCRYTRALAWGTTYKLVVIDTAQQRSEAGSWTLGDGPTEFTGGTEVRRDKIAAVQITLADGRPVLQLTP